MGGMLGKLNTFSVSGIDDLPVEVEVDASPGGLPKIALFGLPDATVKESAQETQVSRELAKFEGALTKRGLAPSRRTTGVLKQDFARCLSPFC